jgi:DNA-binding PucR family transcriptional regulator
MATEPQDLYRQDFYVWAKAQAAALRDLAAQHWNGPLDLEHLAEEVEDLAEERQAAVLSQLERIIEHLLKLEHSPSEDPRRQWMISVIDARGEIERRLTASIRRNLEPELGRLYRRARRKTGLSMADHGEHEAAEALPEACPFALDDLLADEWWPASRHGLKDA